MDSIDTYELFSEIESQLQKRASEPEGMFWFCNDTTGIDEGLSYCWDCIHTIKPDAERGEHFIGGGCYEEEGCVHCEECGKLLQYELLEYGVQRELEHYTEHPLNWDSADECYHVLRIFDAITQDETERQQEVIKIALIGDNLPVTLKTRVI